MLRELSHESLRELSHGSHTSSRRDAHSPVFIFHILIMCVNGFMAFNGGATSATIDGIQAGDASWTPVGIGFLGAMDKVGMTVSSPIWGFMLQRFPTKALLATGLCINAVACFIFGSLSTHFFMFAAKILIGVTEGLQWVWAPQWINTWASVGEELHKVHDSRKQVWMNLNSSVVGGVGAGLGIVVAGFGTANGLSYGFAFRLESVVLFSLWLVLLCVRRDRLTIQSAEDANHSGNVQPVECNIGSLDDNTQNMLLQKKDLLEQMGELWRNKLFCRCAVAFAMVNFIVAGMQFLWVRLYTGLWGVSKNVAVLSQLLIVALGGGSGVVLSNKASFTDSPAGRQRLAFTTKAFALAGLGAVVAAGGAIMQLHIWANSTVTLWVVYVGVFITCVGLNMTPGILQIICMENVDADQTRSFGAGVYQALNNFLGLAMGPCIPQLAMSIFSNLYQWKQKGGIDPPESLCVGFVCALFGAVGALCASALAWCAAQDEDTTAIHRV